MFVRIVRRRENGEDGRWRRRARLTATTPFPASAFAPVDIGRRHWRRRLRRLGVAILFACGRSTGRTRVVRRDFGWPIVRLCGWPIVRLCGRSSIASILRDGSYRRVVVLVGLVGLIGACRAIVIPVRIGSRSPLVADCDNRWGLLVADSAARLGNGWSPRVPTAPVIVVVVVSGTLIGCHDRGVWRRRRCWLWRLRWRAGDPNGGRFVFRRRLWIRLGLRGWGRHDRRRDGTPAGATTLRALARWLGDQRLTTLGCVQGFAQIAASRLRRGLQKRVELLLLLAEGSADVIRSRRRGRVDRHHEGRSGALDNFVVALRRLERRIGSTLPQQALRLVESSVRAAQERYGA
jgi:hypothetical protein